MLEIKNLAKSAASARNGACSFSVSVNAGEVLALCGGPGCGKTQVLRQVAGMEPVASGYVSIDGELVTAFSADIFRRQTAFLPQEFRMGLTAEALFDRLSSMRSAPDGLSRKLLMEHWKALDVPAETFSRPAEEVPDEVEQRLMLAFCGMLGRHLLILDEPVSAQDEAGCALVSSYIASLAARGAIVVVGCTNAAWLGKCDKVVNLNML